MRILACCLLVACSSSPTTPERVGSTPPTPSSPKDAAIDAPPDAGVSPELASAPAWIFRFNSADRKETWTLRYIGDRGLVVVESGTTKTTYLGSATDGQALVLALESGPNKLSLECKREKRAVCSGKKTGQKTTTIELLDCFHPDYKAPMAFGAAPGVEFAADTCKQAGGYTLIAP